MPSKISSLPATMKYVCFMCITTSLMVLCTDIYIDDQGENDGDGSISSPIKSLDNALQSPISDNIRVLYLKGSHVLESSSLQTSLALNAWPESESPPPVISILDSLCHVNISENLHVNRIAFAIQSNTWGDPSFVCLGCDKVYLSVSESFSFPI